VLYNCEWRIRTIVCLLGYANGDLIVEVPVYAGCCCCGETALVDEDDILQRLNTGGLQVGLLICARLSNETVINCVLIKELFEH
jgi:hypothetical protein